eukprot:CAMPEP_0175000898 /NCGR_PEP_ID=MMETSP0005-20121125/2841_1 /TAXON_ID=420556 /ORGANISM="Ochromonas sp., Strain CCMP1393" /LENGTH=378 /DNA_ID=CAMNT_0016255739 /DNA_START=135 /DNA_END=1271 /DNA_ORIENTATION=+
MNHALSDIESIYQTVNEHYDSETPPLAVFGRNRPMPQPKQQAYHGKRCTLQDPSQAFAAYFNGVFSRHVNGKPVLVTTPCLSPESFGNTLSNYFEVFLCAQKAGLHFVTAAQIWSPSNNDTGSLFLQRLPRFIEHKNPTSTAIPKGRLLAMCPCGSICHERSNSLIASRSQDIKPLLQNMFKEHLASLTVNSTVVLDSDLSTVAVGSSLPLIPDAAIHYRCGDNFVGHYGFLPFSAFARYIPSGAKTIYVLAENRGRKTQAKRHRALKCDAIFRKLLAHLQSHFPRATVVIRRGDDLYVDMMRLAYARTVVCSVSTFCIWPAIVNANKAYFPATRLIFKGDTSVQMGFEWITTPRVILGAAHDHGPPEKLANLLASTV